MGKVKLKVEITGNSGFIGNHLTNYLGLNDLFVIIPFDKDFLIVQQSLMIVLKAVML